MAFSYFSEPEASGYGPLVEASVQIQRTMVVGLGGTGGEIIKRLKRRLGHQGQRSTYIRFLSLDTDVRTWLASLQFPALDPRERVPLYHANPDNVLESPHLYPTIQHLWQQGRKVDISLLGDANGAGLMPVLGRTAFHLNAVGVYSAMQRALRDLQAIPSQPGGQPLTEEFRIYIVGSVAGGTGAGCFIETAVLLRHVLRSFKFSLTGIVALPEAFTPTLRGQQLDSQCRGNAYAVLKELQYLQDGPVHWEDPESYTFHYMLGGQVRPITLTEKPFDILYMVDNQNQEGGGLRNLTDIYEMAAQQLWVEIGSPLGAKFASALANERATKGLAPCPETGRPANISSLATAALVIPAEKLLRYCCGRYLQEAVQGRLLGTEVPGPDAERWAVAWLQSLQLEERGGHRMISRELLTDPREGREVTAAEHGVDPESLPSQSPGDFLASLGYQTEQFESEGLPSVRALVDRNLQRLRAELPVRISSMLQEALRGKGLRNALVRRAAADRELERLLTELTELHRDDESVREEITTRLLTARQDLEARSGAIAGLFGRRRERMRLLCRLQEEFFQVEIDMAARLGAMRLIEAARALLEEHRRRLEIIQGYLQRLDQSLQMELSQEQWSGESVSAYALETEVISPEGYSAYFQRFRPETDELLISGLTAEGGDGGLLAALSPLSYSQFASRLTRSVRELFAERIAQLNVVETLQELHSRSEVFDLLDDLARRCRPFWTASPRGGGAFSDVFLIGSPGVRPGGLAGPVQAEPLLQEWVDRHAGGSGGGLQSSPTYVALGLPGAIIFSRQTHGARLHYMRQIVDYQEHYRALQQQRGYPVHFKPALESLPELRPDDEKATECWALATAYGMVAAKTFGWIWVLEHEQRKDPDHPGGFRSIDVLCSGSLWDLAAEIAPVVPRDVAPHSVRFLHGTRSGALGQFAQRRDLVAATERMVSRRLDQMGRQSLSNELNRYLDEVLGARLRRTEEMEAATLTREHAAIRRFLARITL